MLFLLSNESIRQMRREEQGEGGERAKGNLTPVDLATSDPRRVSLLTTTYYYIPSYGDVLLISVNVEM